MPPSTPGAIASFSTRRSRHSRKPRPADIYFGYRQAMANARSGRQRKGRSTFRSRPATKRPPIPKKKRERTVSEAENPVPAEASGFPIVGVGASAGGLEAFTALIRHLPA